MTSWRLFLCENSIPFCDYKITISHSQNVFKIKFSQKTWKKWLFPYPRSRNSQKTIANRLLKTWNFRVLHRLRTLGLLATSPCYANTPYNWKIVFFSKFRIIFRSKSCNFYPIISLNSTYISIIISLNITHISLIIWVQISLIFYYLRLSKCVLNKALIKSPKNLKKVTFYYKKTAF